MRVILLSDTHGTVDPRIAGLVARAEHVVHAGDVGCLAVLTALRPRGRTVVVRGNNDVPAKWPAGEGGALEALPEHASLDLPGGRVAVVHGHVGSTRDRHARLRRAYPDARLVVYGHSHHACIDREATPWVVNLGAAGRARTFGGPSCLLLDARERRWTVRLLRFPPLATDARRDRRRSI